jgi:cadherin EGF LAG seven-pass G-type receptor 1
VFGKSAVTQCPRGSQGFASRFCDPELGWVAADTFNCTSDAFVDLARQLSLIERGGVQLSSYSAVRAAYDLRRATNSTRPLHGSDVLISAQLLGALFHFEMARNLNLTHRKDKDYIKVRIVLSLL